MSYYTAVISAFDDSPTPVLDTLRFSMGGYSDTNGYYEDRIKSLPMITVMPSDGGLLGIFGQPDIGDIELANKDGGLNYLQGYHLDDRAIVLAIDGVTRYSGFISKLSFSDDNATVTLYLKSQHEFLNDDFPMELYAGDNPTLTYGGIEGKSDQKDNVKPKVFGKVQNASPVQVNENLVIYQVSDEVYFDLILADQQPIAAYDNGVEFRNYRVNNNHSAGATSIAIRYGYGGVVTGSKIMFQNHATKYTVSTGITGSSGSIIITPALTVGITGGDDVVIVDFFTNLTIVEYPYLVQTQSEVGDTVLTLYAGSGSGAISANDYINFTSDANADGKKLYQVLSFADPTLTLKSPITEIVTADSVVNVIGSMPADRSNYQGLIRFTHSPFGDLTVDAVSLVSGAIPKAGDVFEAIALAGGVSSVNPASVTELNARGVIGIYLDSQESTVTILDKIAKSIGAYYWIDGGVMYAKLISFPKESPISADFELAEWQITRLSIASQGLGKNGVPSYKLELNYGHNETVQDSLVLADKVRQSFVKKEWRKIRKNTASVLTNYKSSEVTKVDSYLVSQGDANSYATDLHNILKADIDTIEIDTHDDITFSIGQTVEITYPRTGYNARRFIIYGYKIDDDPVKTTTLFAYGER